MTAEDIIIFFFLFPSWSIVLGANKRKPHCNAHQLEPSHTAFAEFNEVSDSAAHCAAACGLCYDSTAAF